MDKHRQFIFNEDEPAFTHQVKFESELYLSIQDTGRTHPQIKLECIRKSMNTV